MFIDNLKKVCARNGTTPTALLKSMGMSTSSVTAWKKGVEPSVGTVYKLAQQLGCDPADLLSGWSRQHPDPSDNKKGPGQEPELDINTLEYALYGEARTLDEDEKQQLLELARLMRKKRQSGR